MDRRHHRVALGVILLATASAFAAAPVRAQQAAPDGSTILFREGVEHLRAARYAEAVEAFRGSYRLSPRVTTMCNLALTYDRWGREHHEAAIRAYRTCAAEDASGRYRPHAIERIAAIERELALEGDAPPREDAGEAHGEEARGEEPRGDEDGGDEDGGDEDGGDEDGGDEDGGDEDGGERDPRGAEAEDAGRSDGGDDDPPAGGGGYDRALAFASIGAGGGAAIALVTGVVLALDAQGRVAALEAETTDGRIVRGSEQARRLDEARAIADGATAAYVVAGILAAAAAGLLTVDLVLASSGDAPTATLRLTPLGVRGAF